MTTETKCVHCGAAIPSNAKFCVHCGGNVGGLECNACQAPIPAGAKFCVQCGEAIKESESVTSANIWSRQPGEFARRVESSELNRAVEVKGGAIEQLVRKGINAVVSVLFGEGISIEEGTRGVFLQGGEMRGELAPGYHTVDSLAVRLDQLNFMEPYTVVMTDIGDVELPIRVGSLRLRDDQTTDAVLSLVISLADPLAFFTNVMRGNRNVTTAELGARISQESLHVVQEILGDCSVEELYGNRELVRRIDDELGKRLQTSLQRYGLTFLQLQFVNFEGDRFDEIREARGELVRREAKLGVDQKRQKFNELVRANLNEDRMNKFQSDQDFIEFLEQLAHEADVKGLIRDQEWLELRRQYEENREDHARCREHVLAMLDLQRTREQLAAQRELEREALLKNHELTDLQRAQELRDADDRHRAEIDRANREHQAKLDRLANQLELQRQAGKAAADDEFEQDKREMELGLSALRGVKEIKQEEADAEHRRKLEELEKLDSLSVETLIAASDSDKAAILAELQKTETLKGMSEEQILALAADKSPEVAKAFAEKFRAAAGEQTHQQMEAMYERMLKEQKESGDKMAEMQAENARMLRQMMETALQTQRDTSVAAAGGPSGPAVIFPPPGSGAATVSGSQQVPEQQVVVACPQCGAKSPEGSVFCLDCGRKLG